MAPVAAGVAASEIDVPVPVSRRITEAFLHRSAPLPSRTRRALTLAAASHDGESAVIARAAAALGLDLADLGPAEAAGLVSLRDGVVEFRHPLARAASYGDASAAQRREVHRALAGALPDRDADRRAWHLASAATGPDEAVSAALQQAAERALDAAPTRRRAPHSSAPRASPRTTARRSAAVRRGRCRVAGRSRGADGGAARRAPSAPAARERWRLGSTHLHGEVLAHRGPVMEGHATLVAAAELAAQAGEPELGALILADAAHACFYGGAASTMAATTRQALALLPADPSPRAAFVCRTAHGLALVMVGEGDLGAETIRDAAVILASAPELARDPSLLHWTVLGALWLREAGADEVIERAVTEGRRQAAGDQLGHLLDLAARHHATADRWTAAAAGFHEAIELARDTGSGTDWPRRSRASAGWRPGRGKATNAARTRTRPSSSPPRSAWRRITSGRSRRWPTSSSEPGT